MTVKKSVYLEPDNVSYLKEEAFFADRSQTIVINQSVRFHAIASNFDRASELFGSDIASVLTSVLSSEHLDLPIPVRAKRK